MHNYLYEIVINVAGRVVGREVEEGGEGGGRRWGGEIVWEQDYR